MVHEAGIRSDLGRDHLNRQLEARRVIDSGELHWCVEKLQVAVSIYLMGGHRESACDHVSFQPARLLDTVVVVDGLSGKSAQQAVTTGVTLMNRGEREHQLLKGRLQCHGGT